MRDEPATGESAVVRPGRRQGMARPLRRPGMLAVLTLAVMPLAAQNSLPRAGTERPGLPPYQAERGTPGTLLPPADLGEASSSSLLTSDGTSVYVRDLLVSGNRALPDTDITPIRERYAGRPLNLAEFIKLRDEITGLYVERGYVTSGAVIPAQPYSDGVVRLDVVEGTLARIDVNTDGRFRTGYLRNYLASFGPFDPVNVYDIERRLQILQSDPNVHRVDARLLPGERRGESILDVQVLERSPYSFTLDANNYRSPAVGAWGGGLRAGMRNLVGNTDAISASALATEGAKEFNGSYGIPLNAYGTRLAFHGLYARSKIVEPPFDHLGIEARAYTAGFTLEQPIERALDAQTTAFLTAEWRRTESFLLGSGFSFTEGPDEGVARIAVLRMGAGRTVRSARDVFAARATVSFGLDALNATVHPGSAPDGRFTSLFGQLQWARRLGIWSSQIVSRLDFQLTDSALLGMEQMAIGGFTTVRGYRENTLVRDDGAIASVEMRIPLMRRPSGASMIEIVPFVDWSYSWNFHRSELGPKSLGSAGLGIQAAPLENLRVSVFWGHPFTDLDYPGPSSLQDRGVHAGITFGL